MGELKSTRQRQILQDEPNVVKHTKAERRMLASRGRRQAREGSVIKGFAFVTQEEYVTMQAVHCST